MLFLLSPAKTLDFEQSAPTNDYTIPVLLDDSKLLVDVAKGLGAREIKSLMGVSDSIADLNVARFRDWQVPFDLKNAKQAGFAFKGDVYTGLAMETCDRHQISYLQERVRILSGLYGILRPLDLMQPYRLEMGIKLENSRGKNLYEFWGTGITEKVNEATLEDGVIVNLASNEYFKSVKKRQLKGRLITPVFKDLKNGQYKVISFFAKKARGLMVRYAADMSINDPEQLKGFDYEGYKYNSEMSDIDTWVFVRDSVPK